MHLNSKRQSGEASPLGGTKGLSLPSIFFARGGKRSLMGMYDMPARPHVMQHDRRATWELGQFYRTP